MRSPKYKLIFLVIYSLFSSQFCFSQELDFTKMSDSQKLNYRSEIIKNFNRTEINTTREDAKFLRIIVESSNSKRGLEVGSANGFGAIHLGMGFEITGGHLFTIEIDPRMVNECQKNVRNMKLEKTVSCINGDALIELPQLEGQFDFLFLDAEKQDYFKYFKAIEKKLTPGAVIVADNVLRGSNVMKDFLDFMETSPDYDMVTFRSSDHKRDGMALIYKLK
jgi:caffeoyl-CoA O-methyltransferase